MFLEKQKQNVEGIVSGFEGMLAKDGAIMDQPNSLPSRNQQLQVLYYIMKPKTITVTVIISGLYEGIPRKGSKPLDFFIVAFSPCAKQLTLKDVASKKDELNKLGRELELTEQGARSLQKSFNEYCPDIRRQENEVKRLRNRYTNVNNQLQDR